MVNVKHLGDVVPRVYLRAPGVSVPVMLTGAVREIEVRGDVRERRALTLTVYRCHDGEFAVNVAASSEWKGEEQGHQVAYFGRPAQIAAALSMHNPLPEGWGFPPHAKYAKQQEALQAEIGRVFADAAFLMMIEMEWADPAPVG